MKTSKIWVVPFLLICVCWSCDPNEPDSIYVNTAPSIKNYSFTVPEDISDTQLIGKVSATDVNNQKLTYTIYEDVSGLFSISEDGNLRLASGMSLDFETATEHNFTVRVFDGIVGRYATISINVADVKEFAIGPNTLEAMENSTTDEIIGVLGVNDPNDDTYTFSISVNNNNLFEITEKGELSLAPGMALDYETAQWHKITVEAQGVEQLISEEITINVINVAELDDPTSFITTWNVDNGQIVTLGINPDYVYDYAINWGDGTLENLTDDKPSHTYTTAGVYSIAIQGNFPALQMENSDVPSQIALASIDQWGAINWQSMYHAFYNCENMINNATDVPDLAQVTNMSGMFYNALAFNGDLEPWDVGNVTNMSQMFYNANAFNGAITTWNVSQVTDMSEMFFGANMFNKDIGAWNVGNVISMKNMFGFTSFNQDISNWVVSNVENMSGMFGYVTNFNQDIGGWSVNKVTDMSAMFSEASSFNQDISSWDVSQVTDMSYMFNGAEAFNQDIGSWDVGQVTNMAVMFNSATSFNQDLSNWNVENVTNMNLMFKSAEKFDQSLGNWNIGKVTTMASMLNSCGMLSSNYGATLEGWANQLVQQDVELGAIGLEYCSGSNAALARDFLVTDFGWDISGDSAVVCP